MLETTSIKNGAETRAIKASLINDMLTSKSLKAHEIVEVAGCSPRSVRAIQSNLRQYGTTKAPPNGGGCPRDITPPMFDALRERLLEKPGLCRDEMQLFLLDEFDKLKGQKLLCTPHTIASRNLLISGKALPFFNTTNAYSTQAPCL